MGLHGETTGTWIPGSPPFFLLPDCAHVCSGNSASAAAASTAVRSHTHTHTHALSPVFSAPENYQDSLSLSLCGRERRPGVGISCRALSPVLKPFGASDCDLSHPSADGPGEKEDGILEKKDKTRGAELEIDEGKAD